MQNTESSIKNRKRVIRNIGIIFLAAVFLLTFFSRTVNNVLLPEVECTKASADSLEWTIDTSGEIKMLETKKIYSLGNWGIKDVRVEQGDEVSAGTLLSVAYRSDVELNKNDTEQRKRDAELGKSDADLGKKNTEVEISKMKNELEDYKDSFPWIDIGTYEEDASDAKSDLKKLEDELAAVKDLYDSGADSYKDLQDAKDKVDTANADYLKKLSLINKKKLENDKLKVEYERNIKQKSLEIKAKELEIKAKEFEIKTKELAIKNLGKDIPKDIEIRSPIHGILNKVNIEKGFVCNTGQVLFELSVKRSKILAQWKLNSEKSKLVNEGDEVELKVKTPEENTLTEKVVKKEYLSGEDMFRYTSDISADIGDLDLKDGQAFKIEARKRSTNYTSVIPNSCVMSYGGKHYVYILKERNGALGVEHYVQQEEIKLIDQDDFSSAVTGEFDSVDTEFVSYSNKVLENGMQVRLKE